MRYLGLAFAVVILGAACGSAWAQDTASIEEYTQLFGSASMECDQVVRGFEYISSLSVFGTSAPSESTQRMHIEAVIYLLEGYGGSDVTVDTMPREDDPSHATVLTEFIDGRPRIRKGGLLGAVEDAKPLLDACSSFVRQHADDLAAFYTEKYGVQEDIAASSLLTNALLERMGFYWKQMGDLARLTLDAALAAQRSTDAAAVEDSLLEITAFASAAAGYPNYLPRSQSGELDPHPCVSRYFARELNVIETDLLDALAAGDS
jgi:hypothetical protein